MQLTSQSKPIRIRVKSGGEEHSTLESLLNKFDVKDLLPLLDGRLSRWLKQQGKTALATKVDDFVAKQATVLEALKNKAANDSDKYDVYYGISSLFFKDDFKKLKLNNINDLFEVWLSGSERPVRLDILIKNLFRDFNDVNRFLNETSYSGKVLSDKIIELNNAEMMYNVAAEVLKGKLSCLTKQEAEDLIFLANDKEVSRAKLWVERKLKRDSEVFVMKEKIRLCKEWLKGKDSFEECQLNDSKSVLPDDLKELKDFISWVGNAISCLLVGHSYGTIYNHIEGSDVDKAGEYFSKAFGFQVHIGYQYSPSFYSKPDYKGQIKDVIEYFVVQYEKTMKKKIRTEIPV